MSDKQGMERKVWVLPVELMDRIRSYQSDNDIDSEVAAGRRLLAYSLDVLDSPQDILARLKADYAKCDDIRTAAQNILATHPRVLMINFGDRYVEFAVGGPECLLRMEANV